MDAASERKVKVFEVSSDFKKGKTKKDASKPMHETKKNALCGVCYETKNVVNKFLNVGKRSSNFYTTNGIIYLQRVQKLGTNDEKRERKTKEVEVIEELGDVKGFSNLIITQKMVGKSINELRRHFIIKKQNARNDTNNNIVIGEGLTESNFASQQNEKSLGIDEDTAVIIRHANPKVGAVIAHNNEQHKIRQQKKRESYLKRKEKEKKEKEAVKTKDTKMELDSSPVNSDSKPRHTFKGIINKSLLPQQTFLDLIKSDDSESEQKEEESDKDLTKKVETVERKPIKTGFDTSSSSESNSESEGSFIGNDSEPEKKKVIKKTTTREVVKTPSDDESDRSTPASPQSPIKKRKGYSQDEIFPPTKKVKTKEITPQSNPPPNNCQIYLLDLI
jgi:hypothetical protein